MHIVWKKRRLPGLINFEAFVLSFFFLKNAEEEEKTELADGKPLDET